MTPIYSTFLCRTLLIADAESKFVQPVTCHLVTFHYSTLFLVILQKMEKQRPKLRMNSCIAFGAWRGVILVYYRPKVLCFISPRLLYFSEG